MKFVLLFIIGLILTAALVLAKPAAFSREPVFVRERLPILEDQWRVKYCFDSDEGLSKPQQFIPGNILTWTVFGELEYGPDHCESKRTLIEHSCKNSATAQRWRHYCVHGCYINKCLKG